MKKFAMAAVAAAALSAGVAQAYTVGTFSNGFVVPNVIHNGPTDTTAVGLINQTGTSAAVYWTFGPALVVTWFSLSVLTRSVAQLRLLAALLHSWQVQLPSLQTLSR